MYVSNKQIAEVFRLAKGLMWTGKSPDAGGEEFLCLAIDRTVTPSLDAKSAARKIVMGRLEGQHAFSSWLLTKIGLRDVLLCDIQIHKMKWVNKLIKEFDSK